MPSTAAPLVTNSPDLNHQDIAHIAVVELCENFGKYEARYLSQSYTEAQARTDFIDPLFTALGWDVSHRTQRNPFEQEVKVERNISMGSSQKRADYAFFVTPNYRDVVFYVEAKRPTTNLATSDNYFQAIRYGWNSNTPLVVLTDFREVHILDCRYRPNIDSATLMCVAKFTFEQLKNADEFAKLYWLFSREAVVDGSIEKRAEELPKPKTTGVQRGLFSAGNQTIGEAFINDLNAMRGALAINFRTENPSLSGPVLTEITQRVLDRLVFMRFLEDKLIETSVKVGDLGNSGSAWNDFKLASSRMDQRYNGVVFKPHRIIDQDRSFKVNNAGFAEICSEFDDTRSPYNFNFIPIHILGSIYEQFLGQTIEIEAGVTVLKLKPEARKAGGVYYTPEEVVRYIVQRTVGELIQDKKPSEIAKMRFADIACGSGSFLITVYEELLRYQHRWYNEQPAKTKNKFLSNSTCFQGEDGLLHLTLKARREILLNCIYGVDIDAQAVEVAQLSLYLKLLEEETTGSARNYQTEIGGALLPSLSANIACGNSLIDSFQNAELFDDANLANKLRLFDFSHSFPKVFATGGFDAIVGNPPWGADFDQQTVRLLRGKYETAADGTIDSYAVFMERARFLLKSSGVLGYIVPDTFLRKDVYLETRKMFMSGGVSELVETGPLFAQVRDTWCLIFIATKIAPANAKILHRKISRFIVSVEDRLKLFSKGKWDFQSVVPQKFWLTRKGFTIGYLAEPSLQKIIAKVEKFPTLGQLEDRFSISRGEEGSKLNIKSDARGRFTMYIPANVKQYSLTPGINISQANLTSSKKSSYYTHPKIWITRIQKMRWRQRIVCAFDASCSSAAMKTMQLIVSKTDNTNDLKALTAILSSSVVNLWCVNYLTDDMNQSYLEKIPVPMSAKNAQITALAKYADQLTEAVSNFNSAESDSDADSYARRAALLRDRIESSVADLYGLTPSELNALASYTAKEDEFSEIARSLRR